MFICSRFISHKEKKEILEPAIFTSEKGGETTRPGCPAQLAFHPQASISLQDPQLGEQLESKTFVCLVNEVSTIFIYNEPCIRISTRDGRVLECISGLVFEGDSIFSKSGCTEVKE